EREGVVQDTATAVPDDEPGRDGVEKDDGGLGEGVVDRDKDVRLEKSAVQIVKTAQVALLAVKQLHDGYAGYVLVEISVDPGKPNPLPAELFPLRESKKSDRENQGRENGKHEQGQSPVEDDENDHDREQHEQAGQRFDDALRYHLLERRDVVRQACDQA